MVEIERKFLVTSTDFKAAAIRKTTIAQGYLSVHPERTVRVRIRGESGYLTIKGKSNDTGTTRFEWETEISLSEATSLFALTEAGRIEKIRWEVPNGNHVIEVDEFLGDNDGLIIAEIELAGEDEKYLKPDWLGKEVTNEAKYYNSYLSKNPYLKW